MQQVMVSFYKRLYTPDPVNDSAVEQLLTNWNSLPLNDDQRMQLTRPFTWDEISKASRRSPRKSSPGSDGLPYEVLGILLRLPFL
jgi:hypothetical protein